jgi:DNA-binding Lrp family transcriptional regulator
LDQDGRVKFTDIAKSIQRTEGTVRNRIRRLENNGIIHGFKVVTSPTYLGYEIQAIIVFQLEASYENYLQLENLPDKISRSNGKIVSLYRANGKNTFMLELLCEKSYDLNQIIADLQSLTGLISLDTLIKEERIYDHFS